MSSPDDPRLEALSLMERALAILDCTEGAAIIAAQLDLARARLRDALGLEEQDGSFEPFA